MKPTASVLAVSTLVGASAFAGEYSASHFKSGRIEHLQLLNVPTFTQTPLAAGTVTIAFSVSADMDGTDQGVDLLFNSATAYSGYTNLLANSALSCTVTYPGTVTATAAQWNSQRSANGDVVLGVRGGIGSIALCQTTLCQNDPTHDYVCLNPDPGQTLLSEYVAIAVSYSASGCYPPCASGQQCCTGDICRGCCLASHCNDSNVCTTDSCNASGVCANTANSNGCDDGQFCTLTDVCSGGSCIGSGNPCSSGFTCNETTNACAGCTSAGQCDDGNLCTLDQCVVGLCQNQAVSDGTACNDGQYCTGVDTCTGGTCINAGNPCTPRTTCDEATDSCREACTLSTQCDDGNSCTTDVCTGGFCQHNNPPGRICCEDNLFCSSGSHLQAGQCVGYGSTCSSPPGTNEPLCNEVLNTCDTTGLACAGETRSTGFLNNFGRFCQKSFVFSGVPHVTSPVLVRTYAQGHYALVNGWYDVGLQGVGTVASELNKHHDVTNQNCVGGVTVNWYFELSPQEWNQAVDYDGGNGIGNVLFVLTAFNTGCDDCNGGVNGRVVLDVTYLDEALDRNLNGIDDFCDFDYNDDGCVDLRDFATFQNDFTGTLLNDLYAYQLFLGVFFGPCGSEGFQMLQGGGPGTGGTIEFSLLSEETSGLESTVELETAVQPEPTEAEVFQSIKNDYLDLLAIEWNDGLSDPMIAYIVLSPGSVERFPDDVRKELAAELGSRLAQCEDEKSCKHFPDPATRALVPTVMTQLMNAGECDSAGFTAWLNSARFLIVPEDCDDNGVIDWDEMNPKTDDNGNWILDRCAEDGAPGIRLWSTEEIAYVVLGVAYQHLAACPCDLHGEDGLLGVVETTLGETAKTGAVAPVEKVMAAVIDAVDGFVATTCVP